MDDSRDPPPQRPTPPARERRPEPVRPDARRRETGPPTAREASEPPPRDPPAPVEVRSREIDVAGTRWLAMEGGRSTTGRGGDSHAVLLLVLFAPLPAADPPRPEREALTLAADLDRLSDQDLAELCARGLPYAVEVGRSEVFADTRKKGQKGL